MLARWPGAGWPFLGLPDGPGGGQLGSVVVDDFGEDDLGVDEFRFAAGDQFAGDDVHGVGLPCPGRPDVQRGPIKGAGDEQVGGVGGPPLGDVRVPCVAEFAMFGQVPLRYEEWLGPAAFGLAADLYLAVGAAFDAEDVAVGEGLASGVDRLVVLPGPHEVAGACLVAVGELELGLLHASCTDELVLDAACKIGGFGVGAGQQDGVFAVEEVGQEGHGGLVVHGFAVSGADPAVHIVGGHGGLVATAELE